MCKPGAVDTSGGAGQGEALRYVLHTEKERYNKRQCVRSDRSSGGREQCYRKRECEVESRMRALPQAPYLIPFIGQDDAQRIHTIDDRPHGGQ